MNSKEALVHFPHQCLFCLPKHTLLQALENDQTAASDIQQMLDKCQLALKEVNDSKLQKTLTKELAAVQATLDAAVFPSTFWYFYYCY